jgi:hypothetical protein
MQDLPSQSSSTRKLERSLAVIGTALCLIVSAGVWYAISAQQAMWPLPALYLLEMPLASVLGLWSIWSSIRGILIWVVVGILFAFVVLGALSVGFLFLPVAILFAVAAVLFDRRLHSNLVVHLCVAVGAALLQAALMLTLIRYL